MRYFGSKTSTIETLYELLSQREPRGTFCDPFGGIGTVGSYFRSKGYCVWSGDILTFPYYFQVSKIKFDYKSSFKKVINKLCLRNLKGIIDHLNFVCPKKGWFSEEYSGNRKFFTNKNGERIEACRQEILKWSENRLLTDDEHAVLLASLIDSMDKVANTAGTYYAYLKNWHRKALKDFEFKLVLPTEFGNNGFCFKENASSLIKRGHFDILYLDPPYNSRSYAHYYHLPETIALEKNPEVHGKSGIPVDIFTHSEYNSSGKAADALIDLLSNARFNLLAFHYADNGIIPEKEIRNILSFYGYVEDFIIDAKGYSTTKLSKKTKHHLFLVKNA